MNGEPWFRRWGGFSYLPVRWQGWAVIGLMAAVVIPFGSLFLALIDSHPWLAWGCGLVGIAAAIIGHVVVVWKLDRRYK